MNKPYAQLSPLHFTDSESDDEVSKPKHGSCEHKIFGLNNTVSAAKLSSSFTEQRNLSLSPVKSGRASDGGAKYSSISNSMKGKGVAELFPPPKHNASRKRGFSSSFLAAGPSSAMRTNKNLSLMHPPMAPGNSHRKGKMDEPYTSGFYSESDDDFSGGKSKVSEIVGRLGTEIQQKLRQKKQRIDEQFKTVRLIPSTFFNSRQRHTEERRKLLDTLRVDSDKVQEQLENLLQLGTIQYEKHEKNLELVNQGSDEVRQAIETCTNLQAVLYKKFTEDMKMFDQQHLDARNVLTERGGHALRELHLKLENEMVHAEEEALSKLKF